MKQSIRHKKSIEEYEGIVDQNSSHLSFDEFVSYYVINSGNQFTDIRAEMKEKYKGVAVHWQTF